MQDHNHGTLPEKLTNAFITGIVLNSLFIIAECIVGFRSNSLALLSDAGHNLGDVATLSISLLALRLSKTSSNARFTYGFHKTTILASLANAVILLIAVGSIGLEAIKRFMHPEYANGKTIALIATAGIFINGISALLFFKNRNRELNAKGAWLHLASDALVSAGVVAGGIIIYYTGYTWIDPVISLAIMVVVIAGTWSLLRESIRLSIDAVPVAISLDEIKKLASGIEGIHEIHHIHVWAISTTRNAMTAHIIMKKGVNDDEIAEAKENLKHALMHLNIEHVTLETETATEKKEKVC